MPSTKLFFLILALVMMALFTKWKWMKIGLVAAAAGVALLAALGFLG